MGAGGESAQEKKNKNKNQTNHRRRAGKEDCYFKKVEKFELNMTGLHFLCLRALQALQNKRLNNLYQGSTKNTVKSGSFSGRKVKNLRTR